MKKIVVIFYFFVTYNFTAQEIFFSVDNELLKKRLEVKQTFAVSDNINHNLSTYFFDNKSIKGYLFNRDYKKLGQIKSSHLPKKYKSFSGSSINGRSHNLYFSNNGNSKFGVVNFSFQENTASIKEIDLNFKGEKYIESFSYNNKFYIVTVKKNKSIIFLYEFFDIDKFIKKEVDLSDEKFITSNNSYANLSRVVGSENYLKSDFLVGLIDYDTPNSIEKASKKTKLFINKGKLQITLDVSVYITQIITINLDDFSSNVVSLKKPNPNNKDITFKSNSFILSEDLLQVSSSIEEFYFRITNLRTGSIKKEYHFNANDSISFKNSPIISENSFSDTSKETEKTKKFLRSITKSAVGVSALIIDNKLQVTLGGIKEFNSSGIAMPGVGIPISSNMSLFFNPSVFGYNSYKSSQSTFIKCLFDLEYNHVNGEIKDNVFDVINEFIDKDTSFIYAETIFRHKGDLVLGTYLRRDNEYKLVKFTD